MHFPKIKLIKVFAVSVLPFLMVLPGRAWAQTDIVSARNDPVERVANLDDGIVTRTLVFPLLSHSVYGYLDRLETATAMPLLTDIHPLIGVDYSIPEEEDRKISESREFERYRYESHIRGMLSGIGRSESEWHDQNPSRFLKLRDGLVRRDRLPLFLWHDGHHLIRGEWPRGGLTATLQPVYGFEVINTDDDRDQISRFTGGFRVEGGLWNRIHYLVDFRDHTESGNGPYFERSSLYEDRWAMVELKGGSSTSYDISESFIRYFSRNLAVTAGRGRHHWGPGQFGSLFLNSRMPPFDYVRFDAFAESKSRSSAVYYTFLHGFLESQLAADTLYFSLDGRPRTINRQKYLSAQRLEVRPGSNLLLAFSQGVVYGDRGLQLGYLTPLNFLYSVQHSNDDKDNLLLSLDGKWRPVRGVKLYGEVLLDDVVVGDLMKSTGNNKSAYTVGVHLMNPRYFWRRFDLTGEYTKIRPFVYSHFFATNQYTHWTSPIGYTLEPNSEFMTVRFRGSFYPVTVTLQATRQNHGANDEKNVGGDIYQPLTTGGDVEYPFLDGRFVRRVRIGIRITWEPLENLILFGESSLVEESGLDNRNETVFGFGWNL